jgi:UDP-N-acetylmuramate dehydrogenase
VQRTVEDNCAGVECLAGIPGTVGGTPVQNVGAYGQEVASTIERVRAFDLDERVFVGSSPAAECGFAYRRSRFNSTDRGRYIVTRVDYRLTLGGAPTLRYADLQRAMQERCDRRANSPSLPSGEGGAADSAWEGNAAGGGRPGLPQRGELLQESGGERGASAGTIAASCSGKEPPRFPAGPGQVKLPAAWLIEQAGFAKGYALGAAGVSSRHTLALINRGGASAAGSVGPGRPDQLRD